MPFPAMVQRIQEYAVVLLDPSGRVASWNLGAEQIKGYRPEEILGHSFSAFFTPEDRAAGKPEGLLKWAGDRDRAEDEGWRAKKDGSLFWAHAVLTAVRGGDGRLLGFVKVTRDLTSKKRLEDELRTSEERFRALAESASDAIISADSGGQIIYWNKAAETIFGHTAREALGQLVELVIPQGLRGAHHDGMSRYLATGESRVMGRLVELEGLHKDGHTLSIELSLSTWRQAGRPYFTALIRDTTLRKRMEADLKTSERRFRALAEAAPVGIYEQDLEHGTVYANEELYRLAGLPAGPVPEAALRGAIHPEDQDAALPGWDGAFRDGKPFDDEFRFLHADGNAIWVRGQGSLLRDQEGQPRSFLTVLQDITMSHGRLAHSDKSLQELKAALDEHAIVAITDARGRITYVNDKFCAISKYAREELLGKDHRIINSGHHPKAFIKTLWDTIQAGRVWKGEIKNRAKDGTFYWVDTTIVPFLDEKGAPVQYIAIRADITARMAIQEEIRGMNATLENRVDERTEELTKVNKELEAFAYSVSHDLRAPLRHIDGFVGLLRKSLGEAANERTRHQLEVISSAARQMGTLIDDLLSFSRMGRAEVHKTDLDLGTLVHRVREELAPDAAGRTIDWRIGALPRVHADPALLRLALLNLLGNALKFTRGQDAAQIEVSSTARAGEAAVTIRDNGAGFDMRHADKLFGVFQRLHRQDEFEGTGIGLANVARIIHKHGGSVSAEGAPGQGAAFTFTLPLEAS